MLAAKQETSRNAKRPERRKRPLYTVWYNYVKQHKSLKGLSPAMQAGISDTLWSMTDVAEMIDAASPKPGKRGPYKKQIAA